MSLLTSKNELNQDEIIRRIIKLLFCSSVILLIFIVGIILAIMPRETHHRYPIVQIQKHNRGTEMSN